MKHIHTWWKVKLHTFRFDLLQDGGTESCYRTTLRFETIQWSHAGEWLLLVRSPEGIADASVLLNVTRASGYSHAHVRSASITYLLLCLILQAFLQEHRRWSDPLAIQAEETSAKLLVTRMSAFPKWRRKRASFSVHIILKSSFSTNFPRAIHALNETRICPTCYATRYLYIFNIANTIEIRWNRSADTPLARITTALVFLRSYSEFSCSIWTILEDTFTNVYDCEEERGLCCRRRTKPLGKLASVMNEYPCDREMVQKKKKKNLDFSGLIRK